MLFFVQLIGISLFAQVQSEAYHNGTEYTHGMVIIGEDSYYLESSQQMGSCCAIGVNLVKHNVSGQLVFRKSLGSWGYADKINIVAGGNNFLYISAGTPLDQCDVGKSDYSIFKVDTGGNVIWEKKNIADIDFLVAWHDGGCLEITDQKIRHWSGAGQLADSVVHNLDLRSASAIFGKQLVLCHLNGAGFNLRRVDSSLQTIHDIVIGAELTRIRQMDDSSLVGFSGNQLKRYSPSFQWMSTSGSFISGPFSCFGLKGNNIYVAGNHGHMYYAVLNNVFFPVVNKTSNINNGVPSAIECSASGKIHMASSHRHPVALNSWHASFFQIPEGIYFSANQDLSIEKLTLLSQGPPNWGAIEFDGLVTLKNNGLSAIHQFNISTNENHELHDCVPGFNRMFQRVIEPGDTVTVRTGTFSVIIGYYPPGAPPKTISRKLCLLASVPNQLPDLNTNNNLGCDSVSVVLGGISELKQVLAEIFPNPCRQLVTVRAEELIESIELIDATGKLVASCKPGALQHELLLPAQGLYFVKVYFSDSVLVRKVLRE